MISHSLFNHVELYLNFFELTAISKVPHVPPLRLNPSSTTLQKRAIERNERQQKEELRTDK